MATVVEFTIPSDAFPLGSIFEALPDVSVELERVVPTNDAMLPYFWVRGAEAAAVVDSLSGQPEIASITLVDEVGDLALFQAVWAEDVDGLVAGIAAADLTLLSARGLDGEWRFQLRAEDPSEISAFQDYCREHGIGIVLTRMHELSESERGAEYGLTPAQREALLHAFEAGYYDDSRHVTLEELAADLDITRQSLSARLRRGYRNLLAGTIAGSLETD